MKVKVKVTECLDYIIGRENSDGSMSDCYLIKVIQNRINFLALAIRQDGSRLKFNDALILTEYEPDNELRESYEGIFSKIVRVN